MKAALTAIALVAAVIACGGEPVSQDPAPISPPVADATDGSPIEAAASDPTRSEAPGRNVPPGELFGGRDDAPLFEPTGDVRNESPVFVSVELAPKGAIHTSDDITAMPRARDPEGDPIQFRYRWSVNGRALRVNEPTLPASAFERGDRIELVVEADDGSSQSHPFRIDPIVVANSPPEIASNPGPLEKDGTFRYRVVAKDADEDRSFRFALVDPPEGMKLDPIDGAVEWTPTPDQAGTHVVTIEVDDRHEGLARQAFDLTIEFPEPTPAAPAP